MKKRYLRVKGSVKRGLGMISGNESSTSLPDQTQPTRSPSPGSQASRRAMTPLPSDPKAEVSHSSPFTSALSAARIGPLSPQISRSANEAQDEPLVQHPDSVLAVCTPNNLAPADPKFASKEESTTASGWPGLGLLLEALNVTPGIFPPFKSAISEFSNFVQVFEVASEQRNHYNDLKTTLDGLLGDISQHLSGMTSPKMTTSMKNLCTGLKAELRIIEQKLNRGTLRRHIEAVGDLDQVLECYRRIQEHLERLTLNANLSIWETVDELAFMGLMNTQDARLQRLSPISSAVYNSAQSEEVQRRACTEGTRHGELRKLLEWTRNKQGELEEVYWMNGMAGTGKTTIAYSLCAELEKTAELGASFFCSRQIPECRDVTLIIPSIAYQLAHFSYPFRIALCKVLEADPNVHTRVLRSQFESLLAKPLLEVKKALPTHCVVVLDALDECDNENSIAQILELLLAQTSGSGLPIRFLLSSRPEPEIYHRMMARVGNNLDCRLVLHDLDVGVVKGDIATYIRDELKTARLTEPQLESLAEHCGVLFIYASTAARYINDGILLEEHEDRLNMILGLTPASPDGKDRGIDSLYGTILQLAFKKPQLDESGRSRMKMLLDTIICTQEPMTVDSLAGLLKLKSGKQVEGLLRPLSSVLNITESNRLVTTLHASFPDYMRDISRSGAFYCTGPSNHTRLAHTCFETFKTSRSMVNICSLATSYLCDNEVAGLNARVDTSVSPWLFYACRYWMTHIELSEEQEKIGNLLFEFLSTNLLLWMEVLNLKGCMGLGSGIMKRAENWSKACNRSEGMVDLTHDAWRFVTMYASHAISQSTPHIYVSMIPFWPKLAPITRYYNKRMQGAIQVQGSAVTRRQLALLATWQLAGTIRSICISPDERLIACTIGSSVWLLDGTTGRAVLDTLGHSEVATAVAFSNNGALLVSGSVDRTVKVWKTSNGKLLIEALEGHTDVVTSAAFSPGGDQVISGSKDGTIRVWSLESGHTVLGPLKGQDDEVWSIGVSSNGALIASGYGDGSIHVWDAGTGEMLRGPLKEHSDRVNSLCFAPDNARLASGSSDTTLRLWSNLLDHTQVDVLEGHTGRVESTAFSPDGKQLVSGGSSDYAVRLWNVEGTPQLAQVFTGHTNVVYCVRFSSDGARIVSSSGDGTIRVWDARSQGPADSPLEGHTQAVTSVAYSHDGTRIVSGSNDGTIYVWDGQSGQVAVGPMKGHTHWVNSVCVSPDQSRIASGSSDKTIRLWDAKTGNAVGKPLADYSGRVFSVCFSPDGALFASGSEDKTIQLWNAESGEPIGSPLRAHTDWVRSVCFSPDSLRLVSGSDDKTIRVWDVNTRKTALPPFEGHTDWVWAVCASPDGTRIASGSKDATVRLWDARSGQSAFGPLQGHTADVNSVSFSPNSAYVVSGSDDKTIRLWDALSGQAVGSPLTGHTDIVMSVAFSPYGRQIVSGSGDLSIRVWDIADLVQSQEPKDTINEALGPPRAHQSWLLQNDGWVVGPQSRLLAWVPPDLHTNLVNPRNPLLISTTGYMKLDLGSAKLGESWSECYEP